MINKESIYNLTELLVIGSVTTAGFLIGGTVGASVMAGLGINLASNILDKGSSNLKSKWINGKDGILNHDIQRALLRAFNKSILEIEKEYLELDDVKKLSRDNRKTIKHFFSTLKDNTKNNYNSILKKILNENEIQDYLSKEPKEAEKLIWSQINLDEAFNYDNSHLKDYFKENLHYKIKFLFGEELKTNNKENNKAWRAFQRMLLEGIKDDVNTVKENQEENLEKLITVEQTINELKNVFDKRLPNEPFLDSFEKGIKNNLKKIYETTQSIDKTTKDTNSKLKELIEKLDGKSEKKKTKEINKKLEPLLKEIKKYRNKNDYDKAENLYIKAKTIENLDDYSNAQLKIQYSFILKNKYYDVKKEDEILMECLNVFQKYEIADDIDTVKRLLIQTKSSLREYDTAEVFANDILTNSKTEKDFADAHIFLGLILFQKQDLKGALSEMDKAIGYGNKLLIKNEKDEIDEGIEIVTYATQNKSLFSKRLGRLNEAKSFSLKAIEGLRKLEKKKELGMALFEITELNILQGNFKDGQWSEYIEEAKSIFREEKDFSWLARCYDLIAKIAFMSNQPELALSIFEEGYKEIQKTNDKNGVAHFLGKFVSFYIHQKDIENAKKSLSNYINYAKKNNIERAITESKEYSLRIAEIDGNTVLTKENLNNLIKEYEKDYNNEQSEPTKAFILGKIASIYEEQGELILALNTFKKIANKYKELDIKSEYAKSLLMINQLKIKLGERDSLLETWQEVLQILDGTNYHHLITVANINCGSYLLETRNLEKAQRYLEEAEYFVDKYKLANKNDVERLLKEVRDRRDFTKPAVWSFDHAINRFYNGVNKNKDIFEPLLRYWYYRYQEDFFKHFMNKSGLNCIIFSDDLKYIELFTKNLSWLFNYYLIGSDEEFPLNNFEVFETPYEGMEKGEHIMFLQANDNREKKKLSYEKQLLNTLNKPMDDGSYSRYLHFPVKEKKWKEIKVFIGGNATGLPSIVYDYFEKNNAKSVLESKYFPLHFDRFNLKDKLFTDIVLCWELQYFPVYIKENLTSDRITKLSQVDIKIPYQNELDKSKVNTIKKLFNSLFKIEKSDFKTALNDFKFEIDILTENIIKTISMSIIVVEVQHSVQKLIYPIIVINEDFE